VRPGPPARLARPAGRRTRRAPPGRLRPSRHQAVQHHRVAQRSPGAARLRLRHRRQRAIERPGGRHGGVHVAGAGGVAAGRAGVGLVQRGSRPVRGADRAATLRGHAARGTDGQAAPHRAAAERAGRRRASRPRSAVRRPPAHGAGRSPRPGRDPAPPGRREPAGGHRLELHQHAAHAVRRPPRRADPARRRARRLPRRPGGGGLHRGRVWHRQELSGARLHRPARRGRPGPGLELPRARVGAVQGVRRGGRQPQPSPGGAAVGGGRHVDAAPHQPGGGGVPGPAPLRSGGARLASCLARRGRPDRAARPRVRRPARDVRPPGRQPAGGARDRGLSVGRCRQPGAPARAGPPARRAAAAAGHHAARHQRAAPARRLAGRRHQRRPLTPHPARGAHQPGRPRDGAPAGQKPGPAHGGLDRRGGAREPRSPALHRRDRPLRRDGGDGAAARARARHGPLDPHPRARRADPRHPGAGHHRGRSARKGSRRRHRAPEPRAGSVICGWPSWCRPPVCA